MYPPLHGVERGSPDKPPVLFLHGFLGAHDEWNDLMSRLESDFRCLAADLPGHGQAPPSPDNRYYTFDGAAGAVLRFLDARGCEKVNIMAYSMGGRLALHLAVHYPDRVRCVVMESASPGMIDPDEAAARRAHDEKWACRFEAEPLHAVLLDWYRQPVFTSLHAYPGVYEAMLERRKSNRPEEAARAMRGMSVGVQLPLWGRLRDLACPLLMLVGERDRKYRLVAERMADLSERMDIAIVPGAGHNAHLEQPDAVAILLRQFFAAGQSRVDDQGEGAE